jgi:hypothetical protein
LTLSAVCFSQAFEKSDSYYSVIDEVVFDSIGRIIPVQGDTAFVHLFASESNTEIYREPLGKGDYFDECSVEVAHDVNSKLFDVIIRLKCEFMACCLDQESNYFVVTKNHDVLRLPEVRELICDGPQSYITYRVRDEVYVDRINNHVGLEYSVDSTTLINTYQFVDGAFEIKQ